MIKKVIFIGYLPLTEKVIADFYFKCLFERGFSVEYWDLSAIYFLRNFGEQVKEDYIIYFSSIKAVEGEIKNQNREMTLFISQMTFEYRVLNLHKLFTKYNCITGFFARGAFPNYSNDSLRVRTLSRIVKKLNFNVVRNYLGNVYANYLKKNNIISSYSIVFRSGKLGLRTIGIGYLCDEKKSKIVDVNSFDFENYKTSRNAVRIVDKKYVLFLDEYLPFHPDFNLFNIKTIDPNKYYNKLNRFFSKLEIDYDIEVVIAAHPKADRYKVFNYFEDRKVVFSETPTLVRDAEFVIAHCSSSINFAVLNHKPLITLLTDDIILEMDVYSIYIKLISSITGSNMVNIDDLLVDKVAIPSVDYEKYNQFQYLTLTSEKSENLITSEIFLKAILDFGS